MSKPPAPIKEEVTGGNIAASYSASLKEWLGPWAKGRGEEIRSRDGKSGEVAPSVSPVSPPSSVPLILSDRLTAGV